MKLALNSAPLEFHICSNLLCYEIWLVNRKTCSQPDRKVDFCRPTYSGLCLLLTGVVSNRAAFVWRYPLLSMPISRLRESLFHRQPATSNGHGSDGVMAEQYGLNLLLQSIGELIIVQDNYLPHFSIKLLQANYRRLRFLSLIHI